MKKLYPLFAIVFSSLSFSQVLMETNFETYTIGNLASTVGQLGTTEPSPGQGGWLALSSNSSVVDVSYYQIENNGISGSKAMVLKSHPSTNNYIAKYVGDLWQSRTAGNNVFKVSAKVYVGEKSANNSSMRINFLDETRTKVIAGFRVNSITNELIVVAHSGNSPTNYGNFNFKIISEGLILPPNAWYTFEIIVDFNTRQVRWKVPEANVDIAMNAYAQEGTWGTFNEELDLTEMSMFHSNDSNRSMHVDDVKLEALNPNLIVNDLKNNRFKIYPNPAKSELNIRSSSKVNKIEIYSASGQILLETKSSRMDVGSLPKGVYIIKLYYDKDTQTSKFIKE